MSGAAHDVYYSYSEYVAFERGSDRGAKFEHYKSLPTLRRYVLVAQERRSVEVRSRSEDGGWTGAVAADGEVAELLPGIHVDVRALYDAAAE
jgi:Uma2 family endonuclease